MSETFSEQPAFPERQAAPGPSAAEPSEAVNALDAGIRDDAAVSPEAAGYSAAEDDGDWLEEPEELPRRPRRRFLEPVPVALLCLLVTACGFIGGVLVEKGQGSSSSSSSSGASLAARFAGLRGGSQSSRGGASSGAGAAAGFGAAAGARTVGEVAFVQGGTLYVSTAEGNTVKVTTSAGSTVTRSVKSSVGAIHPGETVVVTGPTGQNGAVSAESIRVGSEEGGFAGLFGGSGFGSSKGAGGGSTGGGEPALFGSGG